MSRSLAMVAALSLATPAFANVQITEWMYNGSEFIEFTNLGSTSVDFTGWSFDDDSRTAGTVSLSAFGLVAAGESVILAEALAADFRLTWGLGAGVNVIGGNTTNLGRNDEINLFDASGALVDRLTYGDQNLPGSIRTQYDSGNPASLAALADATSVNWVLSAPGDRFGSRLSADGTLVANPGAFAAAVPEPTSVALLLAGAGVMGAVARRRAQAAV